MRVMILLGALVLVGCGQQSEAPEQVVSESLTVEAVTEPVLLATPLWEVYPGQSNFEAWTLRGGAEVVNNATVAPTGAQEVDQLVLREGGLVGFRRPGMPIAPGDVVTGRVWLWSDTTTRVSLQIVRWCSDTQPEVSTQTVQLTSEPTMYVVSLAFEAAHDCVRFQMSGLDANSVFYAWNASVEHGGL